MMWFCKFDMILRWNSPCCSVDAIVKCVFLSSDLTEVVKHFPVQGVRDQIKKMAMSGGTAAKEDEDFYAVSSSESDVSDDEEEGDQRKPYIGCAYTLNNSITGHCCLIPIGVVTVGCRPGTVISEADPAEEADMIARALERSFVFKGIDKKRLYEVSIC